MSFVTKSVLSLMLIASATASQATLEDRGGGLIYDTNTNLTWLQDWNYAKTSGYDSDGLMTWNASVTWADQLVVRGYDDWRLPLNDTVNELRFLWINELGNLPNQPRSNAGPFLIPNSGDYWIGTLNFPGTPFTFTQTGTTSTGNLTVSLYAVAVRVGNVTAVPEPSSVLLLALGAIVVVQATKRRPSGEESLRRVAEA